MSVSDRFNTGGALESLPSRTDVLAQQLRARVLSGYRVTGPIGHGGMGVVVRGERVDDDFSRAAAIKVLPGPASDELRQRFGVERRILAELDHPAIARLYDAGETEEGWPYLVMEFVDGEPIDEYCDRHELGVDERVRLIAEVVEAIRFAHARLIVHRDIKLSNVLVRRDGQVKLLDFGIAKLLEQEEDRLTQEGRVLTPKFASPEQLLGRDITVATDIFQLGALSLCLLSDTFRSQKASVNERIRHAVEGRPTTLPGDARMALPQDLAAVIERCLEVDPASRYPDAGLLATDLNNYLAGRAVSARRATTAERLVRLVRRSPAVSLLVATTAAAILLGVTASLRFALEANDNAARAEHFLAQAERNLGMQEALVATLNQVFGDEELETRAQARLLDIAAEAHDGRERDPVSAAETVLAIGRSFMMRGDLTSGVAVLEPWLASGYGDARTIREGRRQLASGLRFTDTERAIAIVADLLPAYEGSYDELSIDHLEVSNWYALWTNDREELERARTLLRAAIEHNPAPDVLSYCWFYIARISNRLYDYEIAHEAARQAYEVDVTRQTSDVQKLIAGRTALAFYEIYLVEDPASAMALLRENLQDASELGDEPVLANTYMLLADVANEQGDFETAASYYDKWQAIQPIVYPGMPSVTAGMMLMHLRQGDIPKGEAVYNELVAAQPDGFLEGFNVPNRLVVAKALMVLYRDGADAASNVLVEHGLTRDEGDVDLRLARAIRMLEDQGVVVPE